MVGGIPALFGVRLFDRSQIESLDEIADEAGQMIFGYPFGNRRRHQQHLVAIERPEGLGHGRIIRGTSLSRASNMITGTDS